MAHVIYMLYAHPDKSSWTGIISATEIEQAKSIHRQKLRMKFIENPTAGSINKLSWPDIMTKYFKWEQNEKKIIKRSHIEIEHRSDVLMDLILLQHVVTFIKIIFRFYFCVNHFFYQIFFFMKCSCYSIYRSNQFVNHFKCCLLLTSLALFIVSW